MDDEAKGKDEVAKIENVEIEPLSDDDLEGIAGGESDTCPTTFACPTTCPTSYTCPPIEQEQS